MPCILQIVGLPGSGKTTIVELLVQELSGKSILLIDACPDADLTKQFTLDRGVPKSLSDLMTDLVQKPGQSNEAMDWAFNDMTVEVGDEVELLRTGDCLQAIPESLYKLLRYGLQRLMKSYDYVLIDGSQTVLMPLIERDELQTLWVMTPAQALTLNYETISASSEPSVLINQAEQKSLPSELTAIISQHQLRLIGKLPTYASQTDLSQRIAHDFHDCFLRLDIPFSALS